MFCLIIHCHDRHIEQSKQTQRGNTITISLRTSIRRGCGIKPYVCVLCYYTVEFVKLCARTLFQYSLILQCGLFKHKKYIKYKLGNLLQIFACGALQCDLQLKHSLVFIVCINFSSNVISWDLEITHKQFFTYPTKYNKLGP